MVNILSHNITVKRQHHIHLTTIICQVPGPYP